MDGSTDCSNVEKELFLAIYFDPHGTLGRVCVRKVYFCTKEPASANAQGLYECLNSALTYLGIDQTSRLI